VGNMMLQCNSCGATYPDTSKGGPVYLHTCPDKIVKTPEVTDPVTHAIITPAVFQPTPNPVKIVGVTDPITQDFNVQQSGGTGTTPVAVAPVGP
jgi:hypothetical protein